MTLYKYLVAERIDILENELIRYTPPASLNDPFEMTPVFSKIMSEDDMGKFFQEKGRQLAEEEILAKFSPETHTVIKNFIEQYFTMHEETLIRNFKTMGRIFSDKVGRELPKIFDRTLRSMVGVLSLSTRSDSLLMWAHYANRHTGFVLAVNEKHPVFNERRSENDEFYHLRKVTYSEHKPVRRMVDMNGVDLLLTKSSEWAYEEEWRIIKLLQDAARVDLVDGNQIHLFPLPAKAIEGVILGAQMPNSERERLTKIVRTDPRYAHAWLKEAELQKDKFSLRLVSLPAGQKVKDLTPDAQVIVNGLDTEEGKMIADVIATIIQVVKEQPLDLSKLKKIVVTKELEKELKAIWGSDQKEVNRVAQVIGVPTEDDFSVLVYLSAEAVRPLGTLNKESMRPVIHLVHRELGHVHNVTQKFRMFGDEALTKHPEGRMFYLAPVAKRLWDAYIATRLSAPSSDLEKIRHKIQNFPKLIDENRQRVAVAIASYRRHGDLRQLLEAVFPDVQNLLISAADILGYLDGLGVSLEEIDLDATKHVSENYFAHTYDSLKETLHRMYERYPEWTGMEVYDELIAILEWFLLQMGIGFNDGDEGTYIAVP